MIRDWIRKIVREEIRNIDKPKWFVMLYDENGVFILTVGASEAEDIVWDRRTCKVTLIPDDARQLKDALKAYHAWEFMGGSKEKEERVIDVINNVST